MTLRKIQEAIKIEEKFRSQQKSKNTQSYFVRKLPGHQHLPKTRSHETGGLPEFSLLNSPEVSYYHKTGRFRISDMLWTG